MPLKLAQPNNSKIRIPENPNYQRVLNAYDHHPQPKL